jgi:peroxiredoxin
VSLLKRLSRLIGLEAPLTHIDAGNIAPSFELKSLEGREYNLRSLLKAGPVVVAFFKVSCPVCQFTLPYVQRLADRYAGDGVTFLAISQDDARDTKAFNEEYGVRIPTLLDTQGYPVSNAYGLTTVPTILLIGTDNKVLVSEMGFNKGDLETIADELAERRKLPPAPLFRPDESVPAHRPG